MPFMKPDIVHGQWYEIDGPNGTEWIPADLAEISITGPDGKTTRRPGALDELQVFDRAEGIDTGEDSDEVRFPIPSTLRDFCENKVAWRIDLIEGWGARLSAPGYLDCTDWCVFETEKEAEEYLAETYGQNEEPSEDDEPQEGDYATEDHIHWFQYGKLVLTTADENDPYSSADDAYAQVKAHMQKTKFFPSVWFISDHGNAHLISLAEPLTN